MKKIKAWILVDKCNKPVKEMGNSYYVVKNVAGLISSSGEKVVPCTITWGEK